MTPAERTDRNSTALAILRIAVGSLFLLFGEYKVFGREFVFGGGFESWIHRFLSDGAAYPFMVPMLRDFVLPHARSIALLVSLGEFAIGLSLVLGILSRVASVFGLVYMLTLLFSANYPGPRVPLWEYFGASLDHLVLALCFAVFAFGSPAEGLSLPAYMRARGQDKLGGTEGRGRMGLPPDPQG